MFLELPIDVENPYRLYRKGYIDFLAHVWVIILQPIRFFKYNGRE